MEQSPFRNPRLIRRFTILSFSRPMGNEAGIPSPRGGKKMGGKKGERKKEETQRGCGREKERGGRKGENRAHVRSPQAQRVKGRDANGKTSVENAREGGVREVGDGERGTRLEDRQTRGCVPLRSARRAAPACCPTMQTNFLISMYCFHCSRLRGVVASDAGSEVRGIFFPPPIVIAKLPSCLLSSCLFQDYE